MKTIVYKPLISVEVKLHQKHKGQISKFIQYMLLNKYHIFEFVLDEDDAKCLFREMKRLAKQNPSYANYSSNHGNWFIQIHALSDPVLGKRNGEYILLVNSSRL